MERALCRCAIAAGYRYRFIRRIVRIVPVPTMSSSTEPAPMTKVLIFGGKTGWIGGLMAELVNKKEGTCTCTCTLRCVRHWRCIRRMFVCRHLLSPTTYEFRVHHSVHHLMNVCCIVRISMHLLSHLLLAFTLVN